MCHWRLIAGTLRGHPPNAEERPSRCCAAYSPQLASCWTRAVTACVRKLSRTGAIFSCWRPCKATIPLDLGMQGRCTFHPGFSSGLKLSHILSSASWQGQKRNMMIHLGWRAKFDVSCPTEVLNIFGLPSSLAGILENFHLGRLKVKWVKSLDMVNEAQPHIEWCSKLESWLGWWHTPSFKRTWWRRVESPPKMQLRPQLFPQILPLWNRKGASNVWGQNVGQQHWCWSSECYQEACCANLTMPVK